MYEVFQPDPRNCKEINESHFVRIKRGTYAGDLGVVKKIDTDSTNVIVFVVPRLKPRKAKKQKQRRSYEIDESFIDDGIDVGTVPSQSTRVRKKKERVVKLDSKGRPEPKLFDPGDFDKDEYTEIDLMGRKNIDFHSQKETNVFYR